MVNLGKLEFPGMSMCVESEVELRIEPKCYFWAKH